MRSLFRTMVGLGLVAMLAGPAAAQQGRGFGRGGGGNLATLAANTGVQKELKLDDQQVEKAKELDEEVVTERSRHSLMDLAGLDTDETKAKRPKRAPTVIERLSADEAEFDDVVPEHFKDAPKPKKKPSDDDFFKLIEDDVTKPS